MVLSSVPLAKYIACEVWDSSGSFATGPWTLEICRPALVAWMMRHKQSTDPTSGRKRRLSILGHIAHHVFRSLRLWQVVSVCVLLVATSPGFAQSANDTPAARPVSAATPASDGPSRGVKPSADDAVQLLGDDGKPVLIPFGETVAAFQKFLKSRQSNVGPTAPPFSVSGVSFEGSAEANDDTLTLAAIFSISVNRDGEDVLVPLRLNEATLLKKPEHLGPNEAEFDSFDRDDGYRCWLRGKGQHELKLSLAVRVSRPAAARRLVLRLPETPQSFIKLSVPLPKVSAKGLDRGIVRTKSLDNGRTEILAFGPPGNLLDLSWQSVNDVTESKPELQARSFIMAELRADSLVLEATQVIGVLQGTFDKLTVRLPPEFELLEVSGREVKETSRIAASPLRVITLTGPTSGPIELKWVLSAKVAANALRLPTIEGFEVEDARQQKGHVVVVAWEGVNLLKRDGEDRFVDRDTLSALRDVPGFHTLAHGGGSTTVYRFLKQPFRMVLDVQKVEPYFTAETLHLLRLTPARAELDTTLTVRVFRGSLMDLVLPWPAFKSEGWEAISNDSPKLVENIFVEDSPNGPQLRVRFLQPKSATSTAGSGDVKSLIEKATAAFQQGPSEPALQILTEAIKRTDNEFEIRFSTRRPIAADSSAFDLSLPFVAASGQPASRVIVAPRSNLEVEFTPKDDTLARPTTPDKKVLDVLDSTRNVAAWRWETGTPAFSAKAKIQQQSIATESQSELGFDTRNVAVTQRIAYEVAFEPLAQVRLMIPRAISERVRFRLRDSTGQTRPLPPPVFTALVIDQSRQCRLSLDPPQVGKFEVLADFEVERTSDMVGDEPSQVSIPVLQSADAEFSATRVNWNTGKKLVATLDDSDWKPELGSDKTSSWKVSGTRTAILLKIAAAGDAALQDFTVQRALIRTVVSEGRRHSQALFELDRDVREFTLTLPPGISSKQVLAWWNRSPMSVEFINRKPSGGDVEVRLRRSRTSKTGAVPNEAADVSDKVKGLLLLDYYSEEPVHFGWSNQLQLVTPQFANSVWVAQTIWQVVLPSDQHLLTTPRDYAAQFHWQRSLLLWSRQPNFGFDRINRVLNDAAPDKNDTAAGDSFTIGETSAHNIYPVSCFGPPQPLIFWSMSRSAVVGCGAGLALLLGFVLIRIPATRHVLTFLVVGFSMALTALWFAEPVKVLLQPAILGAAMAVIAAIIDRVGRSQSSAPMVTLSSPSDFFAASGSGVRIAGGSPMAEASTAPPQIVHPGEPRSASRSGTGG